MCKLPTISMFFRLSCIVAMCATVLIPLHTVAADEPPLPAWAPTDTRREPDASLFPSRQDIFQGATDRPAIGLPSSMGGQMPSSGTFFDSGKSNAAANIGSAVRNAQAGDQLGVFQAVGAAASQSPSGLGAVGQVVGGAGGAVRQVANTVQAGAQVVGAVGAVNNMVGQFRQGGAGFQNSLGQGAMGIVGNTVGMGQGFGTFGQPQGANLQGILQGLGGNVAGGILGNGIGAGPFGQFGGQNNQVLQGLQFVALLQQLFATFFPSDSAMQFNNANTGQSARAAFANLMGANGGATGSTGSFPSANLPYDGSCANPSGIGSIADGQINQNFSNYVMSIGARETSFSAREANSDYYNQVETVPGQSYANSNVRRGVQQEGLTLEQAQARYGDYGYFQTNQADVEHAVRLGVPRDTASAMNNGGGNGNYTPQEQARATALYIQAYNPEAAAAASRGDYDTANRLLNGKWPSLPGGRSHRPGNDACANRFLQGSSNGLS